MASYDALNGDRTQLQLPLLSRDGEICGIRQDSWIRRKYKTSGKINYVFQASIQDATISDRSGDNACDWIKQLQRVSPNGFAVAIC
jgi:hypothetical protein